MARWVVRGIGLAVGMAFIVAGASTRALGVVLIAMNVAAAIGFDAARRRGSVASRELARTYSASEEDTFSALRVSIEHLGFRVRSLDSHDRTIEFNTGMSMKTWAGQDFTASVRDRRPGNSEVHLIGATSQRGLGAIQSVSWGETEQLGNRLLDRIEAEISASDPSA